jgi:hypothetical protein
VYDEAGVIAITPGSTNPQVTERGLSAMFRMCGRDDQQGIVAGDYIVDVLKGKKVAVLHDKDTYGQGLADATKAQLEKRGVKPVLYEGLTRGEKDFSAVVTKIRSAGADVVYFGGLHPEAGPLVRQLREQGLKDVKFMSDDGIVTDELVTTAGGARNTSMACYMTFGADPPAAADSKAVVDEFRKNGTEPEGYTLYAYASVQPWPPLQRRQVEQGRGRRQVAQGQPGQDRHGREKVGQQGRPDRVRLRGLPVGQRRQIPPAGKTKITTAHGPGCCSGKPAVPVFIRSLHSSALRGPRTRWPAPWSALVQSQSGEIALWMVFSCSNWSTA